LENGEEYLSTSTSVEICTHHILKKGTRADGMGSKLYAHLMPRRLGCLIILAYFKIVVAMISTRVLTSKYVRKSMIGLFKDCNFLEF
jgi:hypothetical protein